MKRALRLTILMLLGLAMAAFPRAGTTRAQGNGQMDWPYYGHDLGNMRFVNTDQINPSNVGQLQPAWVFHTGVGDKDTSFESQPIIVGGTMYVSSPHDHVYALDAATGNLKWTYTPEMPKLEELAICCGQTNRGVAVGGGMVYIAQLDANLVALDANTGKVVWKTPVDDWHNKWTETMAPQYVDGKVLIGASGGEFKVRGHLSAYDANTGKMLWRFYTVPGPGQPGNDTWAGNSWENGGAPVWSTPAVDPNLGLVYLSTGNASPDLDGSQRAGQNLYTASVVAIDLNTGQYRWHFQEVHHDIWDYDGPQPPHLFTLEKNGQSIPALGHANKNGFYFILDRRNGKPLYDVKEVNVPTNPAWQHPWPTQPEPATDPLIPHSVTTKVDGPAVPMWTPPDETTQVIQPGAEAGVEWPPAAYSPRTKYTYMSAGGYEPWNYQARPGVPNTTGSALSDKPSKPAENHYGLFDAVDTTTGKIVWQIKVPNRTASGVTVAGDLVFLGQSNGKFHAVDAKSGKVLWTYYDPKHQGVGGANGAPAVYMVNGREYVVMAFGGNTQVRNTEDSPPGDALIAFALPQPGQGNPNEVTAHPKSATESEGEHPQKMPIMQSAPAGARVIDVEAKDLRFYPSTITVKPGEKIAIHLINHTPVGHEHNIAFGVPGGPVLMDGKLEQGKDGYLVFTAPSQPGAYAYWCDVEQHKEKGMTGTMFVEQPGSTQSQTFQQTGQTVSGMFLNFWKKNGGLPIFGYPISAADQGIDHYEQWFERERFELNPDKRGTPYEVELARLGAEELQLQGRDWFTFAKADPSAPHYMKETGHAIAPQFWQYWSSHGLDLGDPGTSMRESIALFGYPLSEPQMEKGADGQMYLTQWFERARFEYHPNNPAGSQVLLGRLGAELMQK